MTGPLIFVVYRHNGAETPALHHEDHLPPKHDHVVYQLRLDTHANWAALSVMSLSQIYDRYLEGKMLGVLP